MSREMDHPEIQELLPQYAAHSLNETVHQQVEAHLAGCASCQADLADWRIIIDTLRDELAELPPDTAQEQSWSMLPARLTPLQQHIPEPQGISSSANAEPFLNQPEKSPSAVVTRGPAHQRWLGFVSVIAAAFIILASLALFGTLSRIKLTTTSSATRTVVAPSPTVSTAPTNATNTPGCANAKPSGGTLTRYTVLLDMSFVSPVDGWATGLQYNATQPAPFTGVMYHLQNCHWWQFPLSLPKIGLSTISMVSSDEGWAAGSLTKSGMWIEQDLQTLVVYHYQHGQWQQVQVPGTAAYVTGDIVMESASEGWLLGTKPLPPPAMPQYGLLHYLNSTWSPASLPASIAAGVEGPVVPVGVNDVWFQSATSSSGANGSVTASLVHDHDGLVTTYSLPTNTSASALVFPSTHDGWMIGRGGNPSDLGIQPPVLMHFDGTHWQDVPITLPEGYTNSDFTGISLVSAQEGFISGYSLTYAGPDAPLFFYHLHLGHWEVATLPENQALQNAASGTIRMVSATEGWAFTIKLSGVRGALTTTILHYANGVWSVFE